MHRFSFWSTCSFAIVKNKKKKERRNIHLGWDRKKSKRTRKERKKNWFESVSRIVQFSGSMWGRTWCFARGVLSFFLSLFSLFLSFSYLFTFPFLFVLFFYIPVVRHGRLSSSFRDSQPSALSQLQYWLI